MLAPGRGSPGDSKSPRLGFSTTCERLGLTTLGELAAYAESLGYDDLWSLEASTYDAFVVAAVIGQATKTARVGVGVVNAFSRTPLAIAMGASSAQEATGGRFCLGLGSSSQQMIEVWHGLEFERPFSRVHDVALAVRQLLRGDRVTTDADTLRFGPVRLGMPHDTPIWIGALGPRMLRLAGAFADGVILNLMGPAAASGMISQTQSAARQAGRPAPEVMQRLIVPFPGDDPVALHAVRQLVADYTLVPVYRALFESLGYAGDVDEIEAAVAAQGRRAGAATVSDRLLAEAAVLGTTEEQYSQIRLSVDAGVDVPLLAFYTGLHDPIADGEAIRDALRLFGARWKADSGGS